MNNNDVTKYWEAIAAKAGDNRKWDDLPRQLQDAVIHSINILLMVLSTKT